MDFKNLTKQINAIGAERKRLIAAREAAINRRKELEHLALPLDEEIERVCAGIDVQTREYTESIKQTFATLVKRPMSGTGGKLPNPLCAYSGGHYSASSTNPNALLTIFKEPIKEWLATQMATWDRGEVGPPRAEREAEMARLDGEIVELESQLETLRKEAEQAGIGLD